MPVLAPLPPPSTTGPAPDVLAIVLTYSSAPSVVACVTALLAQTVPPAAILVVDNAGRPPAAGALAAAGVVDERIEVLRSPVNGGPAGGHAIGLERFLASGRWAAWVMDDDCIPEEMCLEALLVDARSASSDGHGVFVFPSWVRPDGVVTTHPAWCGFLVSADVVDAVGLPLRELVWWAEDTEYLLWRIPGAGYERRIAPGAVVKHTRVRAKPHRPGWKYYYEARNTVHLRLRRRRRPGKIPRILVKLLGMIVVREHARGTKLLMLCRGIVDGLRGRLGLTVPLPAPRAAVEVLHVLPADMARGAQTYAGLLRDLLDGDDQEHRVLTIFPGADGGALRPDIALDVPGGVLRRVGLQPRAVWALRRTLLSRKPDVVVCHGGEPLVYAALAASRGTTLVYYRIGVLHPRAHRLPHRALYRYASSRCRIVAAVAPEPLDEAREVLGVAAERLRLVPNGRDPEAFRGTPASLNGTVRLLWVGQLTEGKRPLWFIEVVDALRASGVELEATLVGDGPQRALVEEAARRCDIRVLGQRDDVPELMAQADIVCFTSRGDAEGMPGVLIEAGFAGRPLVATSVTGASAVVDHGETGLIVAVEDRRAFTEAVAMLAANGDLRARMGRAARERCVGQFTLEASAAHWRSVIDEVS